MLIGVVADDYTGASDIANTLAKGGLATVQFLGVPDRPSPEGCEAAVVALKSRSIPAHEAVDLSMKALAWLRDQGCRQFIFKVCSTFDSTPEGNIGPVGEALAAELGVRGVPTCPAFPGAGRTVYQGHLFVGDRLLNESGLENHPLNPMTDADLRRWLSRQSKGQVGLSPHAVVAKGAEALAASFDAAAERGETFVIVDAVSDGDLDIIGKACAGRPLLVGGSGIALGLPQNFIAQGLASGEGGVWTGLDGPEVILAGSCSRATLAQIELHRRDHPSFAVAVDDVMSGATGADAIVAFAHENRGKAPLIYSSATPEEVRAAQERHGRDAVAHALDALFASAARRLVDEGVRRLVVAGGETSGAVVSALALDALAIGPEIDPGVPALASTAGEPLVLALKSGNFGAPDFFTKALAVLAGRS
jgi:uncharacterized protein YgbK (DUF1537 family)